MAGGRVPSSRNVSHVRWLLSCIVGSQSFKVDEEDPPDSDVRRGGRGGGQVFVGYKAHLAPDADSRIVTKEEATSADVNEGKKFEEVLDKNALRVTADKAYTTFWRTGTSTRPSFSRRTASPIPWGAGARTAGSTTTSASAGASSPRACPELAEGWPSSSTSEASPGRGTGPCPR